MILLLLFSLENVYHLIKWAHSLVQDQLEEWNAELNTQATPLLPTYNKVVPGVISWIVEILLSDLVVWWTKKKAHHRQALSQHVACKQM